MTPHLPSATAQKILALLPAGITRYGAELVRLTHCPPMTIYAALQRMQDRGWLLSEWESKRPHQKGRPRRFWASTPAGREALRLVEEWTCRQAITRSSDQ